MAVTPDSVIGMQVTDWQGNPAGPAHHASLPLAEVDSVIGCVRCASPVFLYLFFAGLGLLALYGLAKVGS